MPKVNIGTKFDEMRIKFREALEKYEVEIYRGETGTCIYCMKSDEEVLRGLMKDGMNVSFHKRCYDSSMKEDDNPEAGNGRKIHSNPVFSFS